MSRTQLRTQLKAVTGLSATAFIRGIRLRKERERKNTTRMNVSEIVCEVGFNATNCFSRVYPEVFSKRLNKNTKN